MKLNAFGFSDEKTGEFSTIEEVVADALRWRYVRDELAQGMDPRMDGSSLWRFRAPRGRGRTIDEVIDKLQNEPAR